MLDVSFPFPVVILYFGAKSSVLMVLKLNEICRYKHKENTYDGVPLFYMGQHLS